MWFHLTFLPLSLCFRITPRIIARCELREIDFHSLFALSPAEAQVLINPADFRHSFWVLNAKSFSKMLEIIAENIKKNPASWCNNCEKPLLKPMERRALTFIAFNLFKLMGFCKVLCCHTQRSPHPIQPAECCIKWFFRAASAYYVKVLCIGGKSSPWNCTIPTSFYGMQVQLTVVGISIWFYEYVCLFFFRLRTLNNLKEFKVASQLFVFVLCNFGAGILFLSCLLIEWWCTAPASSHPAHHFLRSLFSAELRNGTSSTQFPISFIQPCRRSTV